MTRSRPVVLRRSLRCQMRQQRSQLKRVPNQLYPQVGRLPARFLMRYINHWQPKWGLKMMVFQLFELLYSFSLNYIQAGVTEYFLHLEDARIIKDYFDDTFRQYRFLYPSISCYLFYSFVWDVWQFPETELKTCTKYCTLDAIPTRPMTYEKRLRQLEQSTAHARRQLEILLDEFQPFNY